MIYFCFIESSPAGVPYMQPLDAQSIEVARREAAGLFRDHDKAYAAHIFADDEHVVTLGPSDVTAA